MQAIGDAKIDAISIEPAPRPPKSYDLVIVAAQDELIAIKNLLESVAWSDLDMCARQSADGIGFANEGGEALFAGNPDLELDVEPFEGVLFTDFFGNQAVVSVAAFQRLMDRFFTVLIGIADERALDVRNDPRWPVFLEHAARMKKLASQTP